MFVDRRIHHLYDHDKRWKVGFMSVDDFLSALSKKPKPRYGYGLSGYLRRHYSQFKAHIDSQPFSRPNWEEGAAVLNRDKVTNCDEKEGKQITGKMLAITWKRI